MLKNENDLRNCMLLCIWVRYICEMYINLKQFVVCKNVESIPNKLVNVMKKEDFDRARSKMIDQTAIRFIECVYNIILATIVITSRLFATAWSYAIKISPSSNEMILSFIWSFSLTALSFLIDFPYFLYRTYTIQENDISDISTVGSLILQESKKFCLNQVLSFPVIAIIIWCFKYIQYTSGNWFYLFFWFIICLITISSLIIYPLYFAPLHNHYQSLPQGELRTDIEILAQSVKFPLNDVYVIRELRPPLNSNAYVYGLYGNKHIVLTETVLGNCEKDEVLALLSHELGHWIHRHTLIHIALGQIYLIFIILVFKCTLNSQGIYRAVGFEDKVQPTLPGLTVVLEYVLEPLNALMIFLYNYCLRYHEFQADVFVRKLERASALENALLRLNKNYVEFPVFDTSYSVWYFPRPTLLQRLDALQIQNDL
ncbi:hypothetical protein FQR65_LT05589 [Abscondita terminalis]|nr:hypothetical protein FQR65_LT05589 [Abscondita terminalis]